ncbi:hypothetical protein [Pendulispora albinea]|uniref:Uncharacterized protein n=1 Tax=Pendulispora albinea TaxID=2741071 RepID=A0ABZ2M7I1_9BACT
MARPEEVPLRPSESPPVPAPAAPPIAPAPAAPPIAKETPATPPAWPLAITPFSPTRLRARWAVTRPALDGDADGDGELHVRAAPGSTYIVACRKSAVLVKRIDARGRLAWSKRISGPCATISDGNVRPIAATPDGVVVALPAIGDGPGVRVLRLDTEGKIAWERSIRGAMRDLETAATRGRITICFDDKSSISFEGQTIPASHGNRIALELDDHGTHVGTYVAPASRCTYDEEHHLWMSDWASADRVTGEPRHIVLPQTNVDGWTPFEAGWVVRKKGSFVFIDHDGTSVWRVEWPTDDRDCLLTPTPIAATAQRLLAGLYLSCRPGAKTHFGDVAIRSPRSDDIIRRMIVFDMDATVMRTRAQFELEHPPEQMNHSMQFVPSADGVLAYGRFSGPLGLGSTIVSGPPVDEDYDRLPSCAGGPGSRKTYPPWPVVVSFPVR